MRAEARRERLAEMGFALYRRRRAAGVARAVASVDAPEVARWVALLAGDSLPAALVQDLARSLAFAGIECRPVDVATLTELPAEVRVVIAFGEQAVRRLGAGISVARQAQLHWIAAPPPATLRADAQARRALWSELRRLLRERQRG